MHIKNIKYKQTELKTDKLLQTRFPLRGSHSDVLEKTSLFPK